MFCEVIKAADSIGTRLQRRPSPGCPRGGLRKNQVIARARVFLCAPRRLLCAPGGVHCLMERSTRRGPSVAQGLLCNRHSVAPACGEWQAGRNNNWKKGSLLLAPLHSGGLIQQQGGAQPVDAMRYGSSAHHPTWLALLLCVYVHKK